jgi:Zn-dependent peptidase ImmA (M78 family)
MTMNDLLVPYLSYDEIRKHAENFLYQYNINDTIPVPIEKIIEIDLNISLIPIPGLLEAFNTDGFISNDFKSISIDLNIFYNIETRSRFTLTHEIGHMILHRPIWEGLFFSNITEWKQMESSFSTKQYQYLEGQANKFAGLVLAPSPHLNEKFKEAKEKVLKSGFELDADPDLFYGYIRRFLAQEFFVSEDTIRFRLDYENLN